MEQSLVTRARSDLAAYTPGDLLTLSDLHDVLQTLAREIPNKKDAGILNQYREAIAAQLASGFYELPTDLSQGLQEILDRVGSLSGPSAPVAAVSAPDGVPDPDYFEMFTVEMKDRLVRAEDLILEIEETARAEACQELFRIFHTVKGEAGFLKLSLLQKLYHMLESLLDGIRRQVISVDAAIVSFLLKGLDLTQTFFLGVQEEGGAPELDQQVEALSSEVERYLARRPETEALAVQEAPPERTTPLAQGGKAAENPLASRSDDALVKVSGRKLSHLYNLVSEMLILQDQIKEQGKVAQQLRKVSREVQQSAMSLTTTTLRPLFVKMKRAVRDLAQQSGKDVSVVLRGEHTEVDRAMVEALEDPLVHLVRNCVGHGIEDRQTRSEAGKPEEGTVEIVGELRGNHVILTVRDDGGGLDRDKILAAARRAQLIPEDQTDLTDERVYELIFEDGLSTAEKLDSIAGRGVGMSVVKKTVERFRGSIEIQTQRGVHTAFHLIFPLSSALVDGMLVDLCGGKYILPVENVLESVRLKPEDLDDQGGGARVFTLRHEILPIFDLGESFFGRERPPLDGPLIGVVVETSMGQRCVFLVDRLLDKREFVIKTLGKRFRDLRGVSAAAILYDGEIGFLVDVDGVVRQP